jgi:membrane fusion protein (multidrug efflux system)
MKRLAQRLNLLLLTTPLLIACGGDEGAMADTQVTHKRVASVRTQMAEAEEVSDRTVLSADLLPMRRATLAAEVAGNVDSLKVELGQRVRKGQVLASIDTRAVRQQLAEAEALFNQAQDRFERAEKLFAKRSITKEQHIDAVASRDVADARLASARLRLEKSEVKAPWNGHVASKKVEIGDYAGPGQPLLELVSMDRLKVRAPASAADVPYLKVGIPVEVKVDVYPGEVFPGELVRMGAELDPNTRTLEVEAEIDNQDLRLKPGLFGRMELERRKLADAVLVPLTSIVDFENRKVLYVVAGDVAELREVTLGPVLGDRVLILTGIEAGERFIVAGQQNVANGQRVAENEVS